MEESEVDQNTFFSGRVSNNVRFAEGIDLLQKYHSAWNRGWEQEVRTYKEDWDG